MERLVVELFKVGAGASGEASHLRGHRSRDGPRVGQGEDAGSCAHHDYPQSHLSVAGSDEDGCPPSKSPAVTSLPTNLRNRAGSLSISRPASGAKMNIEPASRVRRIPVVR
jgi:hypothetical protein